jgi:hypothetical protein
VQLFLTIPITSCTAEQRFSYLKCLEIYLRSITTQQHLNHIAILHYHREQTNMIDVKNICNAFITKNGLRASAFALFT